MGRTINLQKTGCNKYKFTDKDVTFQGKALVRDVETIAKVSLLNYEMLKEGKSRQTHPKEFFERMREFKVNYK